VHCHQARASHCQTGSYWIAGYAERRVLVEGWSYQTRVDDTYPSAVQGPYSDQEQLQLNDEVFSNPTRQLIETLRTKYDVQWLLLDERVSAPPKNLDKLTELQPTQPFATGALPTGSLPTFPTGPVPTQQTTTPGPKSP
jgi:hypothetical protein